MKKLLFLLALCAASTFCRAAEADTISFRVSLQTAAYAVANVQDADVQVAIATAFLTSPDTAAVVLTEGQVVRLLSAVTALPEGVAAEPNKELLYMLRPILASRPWLAGEAARVLGRNTAIYNSMVEAGQKRIGVISASLKRNQ